MKRQFLMSVALISLFCYYNQIFNMTKQRTDYQNAFKHIYKHLASNFHSRENVDAKKLEIGCQNVDINSYLHPDTIMEDKYLFNFEYEYPDKKNFVNKYGFVYIRLQDQIKQSYFKQMSKFQGIQYSVWSYETWCRDQVCMFEKKMRVPVIMDTHQKATGTYKQNLFLKSLKERNASEQCIKAATIFKIGYSFSDKEECDLAMYILRNKQYSSQSVPVKYLVKTDNHEGNGVHFLQDEQAKELLDKYQNGSLCDKQANEKPLQIQEFVNNPLLIDTPDSKGHVFVIRAYYIVASTEPLIAYLYDKASLQVALFPYTKDTFSIYTHFCNNAFVKTYIKDNNIKGDAASNLLRARDLMMSYEELTYRLKKQGRIPEGITAQEFILSKLEQSMAFNFKHIEENYADSRFAQNSAMDFIMDENLDLHLLEINNSYNLEERYDDRRAFLRRLQADNIELMLKYLRQRYERIRTFIKTQLIPHTNIHKTATEIPQELKQKLKEAFQDKEFQNLKHIDNYTLLDLDKGLSKCKEYL